MGRIIPFPFTPPAIVVPADRYELLRCRCPACLRLDKLHPDEGFQLALFPYRLSVRGGKMMR